LLTPLPTTSLNTAWVLFPRVSKDCVIRVATNDYSAPWRLARQPVEVRVDEKSVRVYHQGQLAAEHARFYGKNKQILNPEHYAGLWNRQPSAHFVRVHQAYRETYGEIGERFFKGLSRATHHLEQALADLVMLAETYRPEDVLRAMEWAINQGRYDPAVIRVLLIPAPTTCPAPLAVALNPEVEVRDLAVYDALAGGAR